MDFEGIERTDGVRFSWNVLPASKQEASKLVIPVGCLYAPLAHKESQMEAPYEPVVCKAPCRGILNPFCQLDFQSKFWTCPFCMGRNPFPPHYRDVISGDTLPVELMSASVEYTLSKTSPVPPIYLFLVDTCPSSNDAEVMEEEWQALKESLLLSLSLLPPDTLVGCVTFGQLVKVHELAHLGLISRSFVFQGGKDYTGEQVKEMLGLTKTSAAASSVTSVTSSPHLSRFFLPQSQAEIALQGMFERLQKDPFFVQSTLDDRRPLRASGVAWNVAVSLLEGVAFNHGARIMCFTSGPCTIGPGMIVGPELREGLRSHHAINTGTAKYWKAAGEYYGNLARRLTNNGHSADLLVACLDQAGIAEMRSLSEASGGSIIMTDSFGTNVFKRSCQELLAKDAQNNGQFRYGYNGILEVIVSRDLRLQGIIGPLVSFNKPNATVADKVCLM